jgi:hypothetical protein
MLFGKSDDFLATDAQAFQRGGRSGLITHDSPPESFS